ncbi:Hypothetical protein CINCED_3A014123 [Cinara cedri]|uniref:Uncharacterized protein n=1 Tax=Cinara cedri TaxID=506608 RepID=A0A5E4N0K7_9HEMI|nr:Hypothetical protein CINCED_3A014123 [Cinara cedri]
MFQRVQSVGSVHTVASEILRISNEIVDSVRSVNATLIDQCATIQKVKDFNETLERIDGVLHILQPPSSSDIYV